MVGTLNVGIGRLIFGYSGGRKQFCRHLTATYTSPSEFDSDAAMAFMADAFDIETKELSPPETTAELLFTPEETDFWKTALAIGQSLLLSGGIPSFDPSTVLSKAIDKKTGVTTVVASVPAVENLSVKLIVTNYDHAFRLAAQFAKPEADRAPIREIVDNLEDILIKPTRAQSDGREIDIYCLQEAYDTGVQFDYLGNSVYRFGQGSESRLISRSATDHDPFISARIANDKAKTLRFLKASGVAIPKSVLVRTVEQAQEAARSIGFPVVIKPVDRDRSEGVTLDIEKDAQVAKGFEAAKEWSDRILVEEQIPGICHRLVTFQNDFVFSFARHPKAVVGDGETSVRDLVFRETEKREKRAKHKRPKPFLLDDIAIDVLKDQGLTPESIPEKDQFAFLRTHNTKDDGGHNEETTEKMHSANKALAERISRLFRFESMGLDLMATDITKPWYETGARVTEVNYTPQIGPNSAREYIAKAFGKKQGRIPIHIVVGDETALTEAMKLRGEIASEGTSALLTSHAQTFGPDGKELVLQARQSLFERTQALLADIQCEAIVLVVQSDEFAFKGMPMLHVSSVRVINKHLISFLDNQQSVSENEVDDLVETMKERIAI